MGTYRPDKLQQHLFQRSLFRHARFSAGHNGNASQLHTCHTAPGVPSARNAAAGNRTSRNTASGYSASGHHTPSNATAD